MSFDVSGFGGVVNIIASNTFPAGITISQFSEDADAIELNGIKIAETAMGVNGDLIVWARAQSLPMVINVIPGSDDDQNLQILADANRVSQNKSSAGDVITATIIYPDGSPVILSGGRLTDASFGRSISGGGRQKTRAYTFMFQDKFGV